MGRGAREAFVPIRQSREGCAAAICRIDIGQVDLGLDAFVADPISEATIGAEITSAGDGRTWHRHHRQVDGAVEFLQTSRRRRGGPLDTTGRRLSFYGGGSADQPDGVASQAGAEGVDEFLAVAAQAAVDLARDVEVVPVRQVVVQRTLIDELGVGGVDERRRSQPAEEEARLMRVGDVPFAWLRAIGSARGPDASPITFLVRDARRLVRIGGHRGCGIARRAGDIGGEHVRTHRDTLVGSDRLLQVPNGDASGSQSVELGALVAGVALGQAALDLKERGEHDHHQDERCHHGKRQNEGET